MSASSIRYVGKSMARLLEDVPATVEFDEEEIAGATLHYTVLWPSSVALVHGFKTHPDFPWMTRKSATITRMDANMAKVSIKFEGIAREVVKYSIKGGTSTEPVETHEDFTTFAGKWYNASTWTNGAEFIKKGQKDQGKFLGFRLQEGEGSDAPTKNRKSGVKSYLEGGMVFRETKTIKEAKNGSREAASLTDLGKIDTPPNVSDYVDVDPERNWLLITCSVEEVGKGLKVTKEWKLSGRNGWDPDIYGS